MKIVERTYSPQAALALSKEGVNPVLARVLAARGVKRRAELGNGLAELIPYEALTNAQAMADVLADAILANERLLIISDYDADGATACSVALLFLRAYGANVGFLIPNRLEHGYGLTPEISQIAGALTPKPRYIVTVDNGISSHAGIEVANSLGMEVLVTDHHLPAETAPPARLIVNPNQRGCAFPSKSLAGCGVMWYVLWALEDVLTRRGIDPLEEGFTVGDLLPIIAIGTVADVVALDKNNRILVQEGLSRIHAGACLPGIAALCAVAKRKPEELTSGDIAFGLGPRINAAGRLESMDAGVECLTTYDAARAQQLAEQLQDINERRKDIELQTVEQAVEQLLTDVRLDRYTVALHSDAWHQGVIGIVAGRLRERVYRPTFILASSTNGELKGSGRSIPGFHLRDALDMVAKRMPGLLVKYGGHAAAAGVTVRAGGLADFQRLFEEVARELLTDADLMQEIETDGALDAAEMSLSTVAALRQQVWGQAFPEPTFSDVFSVVEYRKLGEGGKHIRMTLEKEGRRFIAVKFRHEDPAQPERIHAIYKLDANTYKGNTSLQLLVDHIEPA